MLEQTNLEQGEKLRTLTSVEEEQNKAQSSELLERHKVEGTPFWIVGNKEHGYFLVMGKYRLSPPMEYPDDVEDFIKTNMWDLILNMQICINQSVTEFKAELSKEIL